MRERLGHQVWTVDRLQLLAGRSDVRIGCGLRNAEDLARLKLMPRCAGRR